MAYYYDEEIGNYSYGGGNPMRPHRVRLTHMLVGDYGLHGKLQVHRPQLRTAREMTMFHSDGTARALLEYRNIYGGDAALTRTEVASVMFL